MASTIPEIWGSNRSTIKVLSQAKVLATINSPLLQTPYGLVLYRPSLIGNVEFDGSGKVQSAGALQLVYSMDRRANSKVIKFETKFGELIRDLKLVGIELRYMTGKSFQDESQRALDSDEVFVTWAMILMVAYVSTMLGKCHPVESKILLSLRIIITIILSLVFAFGFRVVRLSLTQLSLMSIFILLGVGVDDMFIITDAWNRAQDAEAQGAVAGTRAEQGAPGTRTGEAFDIPRHGARLARTLEEVGGSILLTSLTDFAALMIGSTISIPAVSVFCKVAGTSVLAVFVTQVTFFSAMLVIDRRRVEDGRLDVLFCLKMNENNTVSCATKIEVPTERGADGENRSDTASSTPLSVAPLSNSVAAIRIALTSSNSSCAVVIGFLCVDLSLGWLAFSTVSTEADWATFLPKGSQLLDLYKARERAGFGEVGILNFVSTDRNERPLNVSMDKDVAALQEMSRKARDLSFVVGLDSWFEAQLDNMHAARRAMAIRDSYGWLAREENMWFYTRDTVYKTLAEVVVIALIFLEPWLAFVTTLSVALAAVCVFGTMAPALFNIPLNVSSFINLVLAIGFAVDYSAHVAEGYMFKSHTAQSIEGLAASPRELVLSAMEELGGSVLNGGFSDASWRAGHEPECIDGLPNRLGFFQSRI